MTQVYAPLTALAAFTAFMAIALLGLGHI